MSEAPILRDTARSKGRDALQKNIQAALALAEAIRSTLGPKGLDKLLIDDEGRTLVTNDGVTVLETAKVEHPVAKMMIGILGTLAEFELTRIKERQAEGIAKAKQKGSYAGRLTGSTESTETFANKKSTKEVLKYLRQGYSISKAAKLSSTSTGTVKKVKKKIPPID